MGKSILVVVYVWLGIGVLFTLIEYFRNETLHEAGENYPLLTILIFIPLGLPILVWSFIEGTIKYLSEKRKQKEHQEDS